VPVYQNEALLVKAAKSQRASRPGMHFFAHVTFNLSRWPW